MIFSKSRLQLTAFLCAVLCTAVFPEAVLPGTNTGASVYIQSEGIDSRGLPTFSVWASNAKDLKGYDIEIQSAAEGVLFSTHVVEGDMLSSRGGATFFMAQLKSEDHLWISNAVEGTDTRYTPTGSGHLFSFKVKKMRTGLNLNDLAGYFKFSKVVFADADLNKDQIMGGRD